MLKYRDEVDVLVCGDLVLRDRISHEGFIAIGGERIAAVIESAQAVEAETVEVEERSEQGNTHSLERPSLSRGI